MIYQKNIYEQLYIPKTAYEVGIIREAFFVSELTKIKNLKITLPKQGDFKVELNNKTYYFEIGGKSKKQNKYPKNTFIVKDGIQVSENKNIIPLWLFGFLN